MVEWSHKQLKDALRARLATHNWPDHILWVLLVLLAAPKEDTAVSSAELFYGTALTLRGQFIVAEEPTIIDILQQPRTAQPLFTRPLPLLGGGPENLRPERSCHQASPAERGTLLLLQRGT